MSTTVTHQRPAGLLARLRSTFRAVLSPPAGQTDQLPFSTGGPVNHRHQDALAVLSAARAVVRRGWAQNTWYVVAIPAGRRRLFPPVLPIRLDRTEIVQACLVGAVMHATWQQSSRPAHAYPAIDALWHTLLDGGGPAGAEPVGPVCSPLVRVARVRDLTTWNDRPHRTKEEVLDLLDRTAARIAGSDSRRRVRLGSAEPRQGR